MDKINIIRYTIKTLYENGWIMSFCPNKSRILSCIFLPLESCYNFHDTIFGRYPMKKFCQGIEKVEHEVSE